MLNDDNQLRQTVDDLGAALEAREAEINALEAAQAALRRSVGMTNAQAALLAAVQQVNPKLVPHALTETKRLAREYITWLDQQDEIERRLIHADIPDPVGS